MLITAPVHYWIPVLSCRWVCLPILCRCQAKQAHERTSDGKTPVISLMGQMQTKRLQPSNLRITRSKLVVGPALPVPRVQALPHVIGLNVLRPAGEHGRARWRRVRRRPPRRRGRGRWWLGDGLLRVFGLHRSQGREVRGGGGLLWLRRSGHVRWLAGLETGFIYGSWIQLILKKIVDLDLSATCYALVAAR